MGGLGSRQLLFRAETYCLPPRVGRWAGLQPWDSNAGRKDKTYGHRIRVGIGLALEMKDPESHMTYDMQCERVDTS